MEQNIQQNPGKKGVMFIVTNIIGIVLLLFGVFLLGGFLIG